MMVCKNAENLIAVHNNIKEKLADPKIRGLSKSVYTTLDEYFNLILPQLQYARFSKTLEMREGINIMDLERFKVEIQSLVLRSVLEEVLNNQKKTIVVIPEAWKFLPEKRGNPCKQTAEEFIRQGAVNENFLWIDSQDMAGVDKGSLKQVATWILGLQLERNEVKHTLDQIPLPKRSKPKADEIMRLKLGHFIVATPEFCKNIYVQPIWLSDKIAKQIAKGKKDVKSVARPEAIARYGIAPRVGFEPTKAQSDFEAQRFYAKVQQDLVEVRQDFFTKISQLDEKIQNVASELFKLQSHPQEINKEEIVSLVLQKMPNMDRPGLEPGAEEAIINKVLARVPKIAGSVTYEVAPLEKIQKDFLEAAKQKILADVNTLTNDEKKALKYIESRKSDIANSELVLKCFFLKQGGSSSTKISRITNSLKNFEFITKTAGGRSRPNLKSRIKTLIEPHNASNEEIEQVYNHIVMEMLK